MTAPTQDATTIIHLVSLMGAISVQDNTLAGFALTLPFGEQITRTVTHRAIGLGLVERLENGTLMLSADGAKLLREADVDLWRGLKLPKSDRPRLDHDTLRQRAWSAMRLSGRFTAASLVTLAARDEVKPAVSIKYYISKLALAGYLLALPNRARNVRGNAVHRQWRLLRDTGPHAPVYRPGLKSLFDLNLGDHVDCHPSSTGGQDGA